MEGGLSTSMGTGMGTGTGTGGGEGSEGAAWPAHLANCAIAMVRIPPYLPYER